MSVRLTNRKEAEIAGYKHYQGSRCLRDHDGLRYTSMGACVHCVRLNAKRQFEEGTRTDPDYVRNYHLKRSYGIVQSDYIELLSSQKGRCAICSAEPDDRRLAVDHCHDTGKVRALLCMQCNTALGKFNDDPARLRAAADYIEHHQRRHVLLN